MEKIQKFGTFAGVFTPSLLTILGVIMYMRLGWVVGNAGNNLLVGAAGNDTLDGASGNDTLRGDLGNDTIDGGGGYNTYVVTGRADAF